MVRCLGRGRLLCTERGAALPRNQGARGEAAAGPRAPFDPRCAGGGFLGAAFYQTFQWAYITFQINVAKYNAIYGSFAALPLFDDPDVKKAWSGWIDMEAFKAQAKLARNDVNPEWKGMWSEFFRPLMAKAFVGGATVKEVMDEGAAKWKEYQELLGQ